MSLKISNYSIISLLIILSTVSYLSIGTASPSPIMLTTDKKKYHKNEIIRLEVANRSDLSIWYIEYPQRDLVFWTLEKYQNSEWRRLDFWLPFQEDNIDVCHVTLYERPIGFVKELKEHESFFYEWNKKICLHKNTSGLGSFSPDAIERGRYRFVLRYSLHTVQIEDVESEPWKRPVELGKTNIVYSNEFVLE